MQLATEHLQLQLPIAEVDQAVQMVVLPALVVLVWWLYDLQETLSTTRLYLQDYPLLT
jgi:hypothetical protein